MKAVLLLGLVVALFGGCNLERFRHEKYSCNNQRLDIHDITIRHAKKGGTAKISGLRGEHDATITSVNSKSMVVESVEISLQIDRSSGRVTARKSNKYYSMDCKLSVFTL